MYLGLLEVALNLTVSRGFSVLPSVHLVNY